ncbi:Aste57867_22288 [Aphanomyces stellatus]|uniref:Aste57867_22288 protein n=1 Tax=Aphanomyces stellatus TaxID=120398 RepID=A0A485LJQ8_9STRA|nr:hypothetical protein As57867_022218 [Aphanomyces stellatus]VFT98954.1 Aste57867_22288 [Aphanomyces stellatus]
MGQFEVRRQNRCIAHALYERDTLRTRLRDILDDMLPRHVVTALQDGVKPLADAFEPVTIFFSDIVSFTEICAAIPAPRVLVLDALVRKHELFKVETIEVVVGCSHGARVST